jgi:hypothetical protein
VRLQRKKLGEDIDGTSFGVGALVPGGKIESRARVDGRSSEDDMLAVKDNDGGICSQLAIEDTGGQ